MQTSEEEKRERRRPLLVKRARINIKIANLEKEIKKLGPPRVLRSESQVSDEGADPIDPALEKKLELETAEKELAEINDEINKYAGRRKSTRRRKRGGRTRRHR